MDVRIPPHNEDAEHDVLVRVHPEITSTIKVNVVAE